MFVLEVLALAAALGPAGASADDPAAAPLRVGLLLESEGPWAEQFAAGAAYAAAAVDGPRLELVRLAPAADPWRDGPGRIARLVVEHDLAALVGPQDGMAAHAAAQVATRLRLPVLSLSPEISLAGAKDPWVLPLVPTDAQQAMALLRWAAAELGRTRGSEGLRACAVVPPGREGRERLAGLRSACRALGVELAHVLERPADPPPAAELPPADVVLLWLDAAPALRFLDDHARALASAPVLATARLDRPALAERGLPPGIRLALPLLREPDQDQGFALGRRALDAVARAARDVGGDATLLRAALEETLDPASRLVIGVHRIGAGLVPAGPREESTHD